MRKHLEFSRFEHQLRRRGINTTTKFVEISWITHATYLNWKKDFEKNWRSVISDVNAHKVLLALNSTPLIETWETEAVNLNEIFLVIL